MLFVLFQLGQDRYALEAACIVEIVPLLALKTLPQAPRGVAGLFNYRGRAVPAIDLSELSLGRPSSQRLSTRILVVEYPVPSGETHLLGLIAEHATEMLRTEERDFLDTGLNLAAAPYLGGVLIDSKGPIQRIHPRRLLPEELRLLLFANPTPSTYAAI